MSKSAGAYLGPDGIELADGTTFPIRVVDWDEATEKAANITANNQTIQGEFQQAELDDLLREVQANDAALFEAVGLAGLVPEEGKRIKRVDVPVVEWSADDLKMECEFMVRAPLEAMPAIRKMLRAIDGLRLSEISRDANEPA